MSAMRRVALMDWDNTIRQGWTIRDWACYLAEQNLLQAEAVSNVEGVIERYTAGHCGYTQMANTVLKVFAEGLRGQSADAVAAQAPSFIEEDGDRLFPFAEEALHEFRARGLALIVISGAPEEVLDAAARQYGFAEVRGSVFNVKDGEYVGTVKHNRATVGGKETAIAPLLGTALAVLAIGDSEADIPLLEQARVKVIVGDRELAKKIPDSIFVEPRLSDISSLLEAVDAL
jgi:phosphoserine phosphatase